MRIAARLVPLLALVGATAARAYEFEISSTTVGQAYSTRWFRPAEEDRLLNRRRLTESLGLEVWDLLEPDFDARRPDPPPLAPFQLGFSGQLRLDHDLGEYTQADIVYPVSGGTARDRAPRVIPELGAQDFALEVLWAYVSARGIAGVVDAEVGRQLIVDNLDWIALDGVHARARLPLHFYVEGQAGFVVRESSPLGDTTHAPDGSPVSQCQTFSALGGSFVASDTCDQESRPAPTFGAALGARGLGGFSARLSYRRTLSRTVAAAFPDDAPGWGVLEEKLSAEVRGVLADGALRPWAAARWNLLLGLLDEAHAGLRWALGAHALTLEALYSYPSFDGDSIWNVFSMSPYWDARATVDVWPGRGSLRGYARGFVRQFRNDAIVGTDAAATSAAAGGGLGGRWQGDGGWLRLDLFYEDGSGGLRAGGDLSGRWRLERRLGVEGRLSLMRLEEDSLASLSATSLGLQAGGVWTLGPGMAIHFIAEENSNRFDRSQLRLVAVLDLAFRPEH
jgi:hypothetical protein